MAIRNSLVKLFLIFILLFSFVSKAQINPVYKIMKHRGWVSPIENGMKKLTPDQNESNELASMGYTDSIMTNLKKNGVDLLKLQKAPRPWSEKILAALSDCIVIGTVSRIEHPKGMQWFQTVAYVQVEEYLRNDYNLPISQIHVMIVSGPTRTLIGEDTLKIGEHVMLFLSAGSLIRFSSNNNMRNLYNKLINDSTINFKIIAKFDINSGKAIVHRREKRVADIKDDINVVDAIVHHILSTNK